MNTFSKLTKQEHRVLECIALGWRNAKIASELYISPRTVETHLYHIFNKLGVSSRTEAALFVRYESSNNSAKIRGISQDAIDIGG